jgi:hypothetical protein
LTVPVLYSHLQPTSSATGKETDRNAYSVRAKLAPALVQRFLVTEEEHQQIRDPRRLEEAAAENRTFSYFLILGRKRTTVNPQGKSENADLAAHLLIECFFLSE